MLDLITQALTEAWQNFVGGLAVFLPRMLAMVAILLVGGLVAWLLGRLTQLVLAGLRVPALLERAGGGESLRRLGLPGPDRVAGTLVQWIVLAAFLLSALQALGLTGMELVVSDFMRFVPRILTAVLVLAAGFAIATFAWRATLLAAVNASVHWARALAELVRFMILTLAVAMALEQVAVAHTVVLMAFAITFGAVMLGLAIALGIGGSGVVRQVLERRFRADAEDRRTAPADPLSHL